LDKLAILAYTGRSTSMNKTMDRELPDAAAYAAGRCFVCCTHQIVALSCMQWCC